MDGWEKLVEAATQTTLATMERARQLEEHRRRTQEKDTDLTIEQLRDSIDQFDHAAELAEDIGDDFSSICPDCGGIGQIRAPLDYGPRYEWVDCPNCEGFGSV